jgi:hypothetical protein
MRVILHGEVRGRREEGGGRREEVGGRREEGGGGGGGEGVYLHRPSRSPPTVRVGVGYLTRGVTRRIRL